MSGIVVQLSTNTKIIKKKIIKTFKYDVVSRYIIFEQKVYKCFQENLTEL